MQEVFPSNGKRKCRHRARHNAVVGRDYPGERFRWGYAAGGVQPASAIGPPQEPGTLHRARRPWKLTAIRWSDAIYSTWLSGRGIRRSTVLLRECLHVEVLLWTCYKQSRGLARATGNTLFRFFVSRFSLYRLFAFFPGTRLGRATCESGSLCLPLFVFLSCFIVSLSSPFAFDADIDCFVLNFSRGYHAVPSVYIAAYTVYPMYLTYVYAYADVTFYVLV